MKQFFKFDYIIININNMDNLLNSDHPWHNLRLELKEKIKPVSIMNDIKQENNEECFLKRNICESSLSEKGNNDKKKCYQKHCLIM